MSYSGWNLVATGIQMVARAAVSRAAEQSSHVASRALVHGADLMTRATNAPSQELIQKMMQQMSAMKSVRSEDTIPPPVPPPVPPPDPPPGPPHAPLPSSLELPKPVEEIERMPEPTKVDPFATTTGINASRETSPVESYDRLKEGQAVPSTRAGRAMGFAQLGFGLAFGAVGELSSRLMGGGGSSSSIVGTDANADRLASTLCRMRGAALKMGQMLSIQDESLLPPALTRALNQVRQGADAMPKRQLIQQLELQLGPDWREKFVEFDELPFAAASIGQVHRATLAVGSSIKDVVVKVQYPGVANSIESDLKNLTMLVKMTGLAPKGLFIDNVVRVGRDELKVECDYLREKGQQRRFKELVESDPVLRRERFAVPDVIDELTTAEIITSEFCPGGTIDKVVHLSQEERNRIGTYILYLTIQELFVWRFMQTDPNWGNFLYDVGSQTTFLIDFGATREYSKSFVDGYLRIVCANANRDEKTLMEMSHKMNFLTGEENEIMLQAHKMSGFTVGEPFASDEPFHFRDSNISSRLGDHSSVFMQHRLTPPPEEVYTLHRKLAGAYMLCIKLGASVNCRSLLRNVVNNHKFEDGMEPPEL
jgi:aarF domain-containing kinase